jgi:hypothetical protein
MHAATIVDHEDFGSRTTALLREVFREVWSVWPDKTDFAGRWLRPGSIPAPVYLDMELQPARTGQISCVSATEGEEGWLATFPADVRRRFVHVRER